MDSIGPVEEGAIQSPQAKPEGVRESAPANGSGGATRSDPTVPDGTGPAPARLVKGSAWSTIGQLTPVLVTVFLTPYVIHGLGVTRYGMFVLTSTLAGFLATFDGGIMGTAQRYFGVCAGSGDVQKATRVLVTLFCLIAGFGFLLSTAGWFAAKPIVSLLHLRAQLRPQSVFLMRTLGVLVTFSFFHNLFVGLLRAHHRFAFITKAGFAVYGLWAIGLVLTVQLNWGLRGVAAVFVGQQVFLALVIIPASLRYVRKEFVGFLPRSELRELMRYALRMQVNSISILINTEVDTLIVGAAVSVRTVSFYNAGASFALQASEVADTAAVPLWTAISNAFGQGGQELALERLRRLQRVWVVVLTGWFAAGAGAAWFAIVTWLGPKFALGGIVALIALMGQLVYLSTVLLRGYCAAIGRLGLVSRFGVLSVLINLGLTIPLVLLGPIGVVSATAVGQLLGAVYLIRLVRRKVSDDLPNPLSSIPWLPGALTGLIVAGMEFFFAPYLPRGGLGLLGCGIPAAAGLAAYALAVLGPSQLRRLLAVGLARRRGMEVPWPAITIRLDPTEDG